MGGNIEKDRLSKEVSDLLWDSSNTINISSRSIEELVHLLRIGKVKVSRWKETKDIFNHIDGETHINAWQANSYSRPQRP